MTSVWSLSYTSDARKQLADLGSHHFEILNANKPKNQPMNASQAENMKLHWVARLFLHFIYLLLTS